MFLHWEVLSKQEQELSQTTTDCSRYLLGQELKNFCFVNKVEFKFLTECRVTCSPLKGFNILTVNAEQMQLSSSCWSLYYVFRNIFI